MPSCAYSWSILLATSCTFFACAGEDTSEGGGAPALEVVGAAPSAAAQAATTTKAFIDTPETRAKVGGPELWAVSMAVIVRERPDRRSKQVGYLRLGDRVVRAAKPAAFDACQGGFYNVLPKGFVCLDDGASVDPEHPLVKAKLKTADRSKPLPYTYAFVRAIAPRYYRLPRRKEQFKYEMSLKRHLRSYRRLHEKWNRIAVGSNDVPMDADGLVVGRAPLDPPELRLGELFGGDGDDTVPWFFKGKRTIPNVSGFKVPSYAIITNRIKRHAGVALLDSFQGDERHFAMTTDLRLIPSSKLKPGRGSIFHGTPLGEDFELPIAFVRRKRAYKYDYEKGSYRADKQRRYSFGMPIQLTGQSKRGGKKRMLETEEGMWVRARDLAIVAKVSRLPKFARKGPKNQRWIDVSIQRQTLILYEGTKPIYATMVSTGKDGLGDPRKSHSTPRGTFRIREKHVTHTMDSQVVGSEFELADVPWVQYFKAGYALHAAYWHTEFGKPRSHGCINLSPIDAYRIFRFTDPPVPTRWHGAGAANKQGVGTGTIVHVHP